MKKTFHVEGGYKKFRERRTCEKCGDWNWNDAPHECQTSDMVNHPPHYTQGEIECIDAIRAALTPEEFRGYCKGAGLKYIWRERHKGGNESLAKANWYLDRAQK